MFQMNIIEVKQNANYLNLDRRDIPSSASPAQVMQSLQIFNSPNQVKRSAGDLHSSQIDTEITETTVKSCLNYAIY
jgi:hypothetical protein